MTVGDSGLPVYDEEHFVALASKVLPADYIAGLKAGDGYELVEAQAKVFARASEAIQQTGEGFFAAFARGGDFARGTVSLRRENLGSALIVKAGSVFAAGQGRFYRLVGDVAFSSVEAGPKVGTVVSIFQDWQHNAAGEATLPTGEVVPGEIVIVRSLVEDPIYGDPTVSVGQPSNLTGGRFPMLDMVARDSNIVRYGTEGDESLAYRTRNLPDNLTPAAIRRAVAVLLEPYRGEAEFVETFDPDVSTIMDMPDEGPHSPLDDPRPRSGSVVNWCLDSVEQWGTFYVILPKLQPIEDRGLCLDDPAETLTDLTSPRIPGGRRTPSMLDMPDIHGDYLDGCLDGRDSGNDALAGSVWKLLQSIRAAGIVAGLHEKGR